jgi:hypothetical protein
LRIKSRVINKAIDKNPQIVLHIMGFDVAILVLLINSIHHIVSDLISDVINMSSTLDGGNAINEAGLLKKPNYSGYRNLEINYDSFKKVLNYLLELTFSKAHANLPPLTNFIVETGQNQKIPIEHLKGRNI